ncbi:MAG: hypothetical protein ABFD89_29480 [Bryobacteraceae bacterium]
MALNKAQYSLQELQLFQTFATPEEYQAVTGKQAPWIPERPPKLWYDPRAEEQLAANPGTKKYKTYPFVLAVNEATGAALADISGKPYFDPDGLILPIAEAAIVNIPPNLANIPAADVPAVQCPMRPLDEDEELAWGMIGGVVVVRNRLLWGAQVVEAATTFMPSDRALLQAIAAKLGVAV